jgi:site-specific recombinase XerD
LPDLRDRALIAALTYSSARVSAALKMKVENLRPRGSAWSIRLHEKGGKHHTMPCHHDVAEALHAISKRPVLPRTARDGCFGPRAVTTAMHYPIRPWISQPLCA